MRRPYTYRPPIWIMCWIFPSTTSQRSDNVTSSDFRSSLIPYLLIPTSFPSHHISTRGKYSNSLRESILKHHALKSTCGFSRFSSPEKNSVGVILIKYLGSSAAADDTNAKATTSPWRLRILMIELLLK